MSEAFFACSALVHVYGSFIFIFFHPPKGELLGKAPQKVLLGGLAMAISVLYFLKPAWRPTAASAGSAAPPAALRWLLASVPLAVSPAVLFSSFTIFGPLIRPALGFTASLHSLAGSCHDACAAGPRRERLPAPDVPCRDASAAAAHAADTPCTVRRFESSYIDCRSAAHRLARAAQARRARPAAICGWGHHWHALPDAHRSPPSSQGARGQI